MKTFLTILSVMVITLTFTIMAQAEDCRRLLGQWNLSAETLESNTSVIPIGTVTYPTFNFTHATYYRATGVNQNGTSITAEWNTYYNQYEINVYDTDLIWYANISGSYMWGDFWADTGFFYFNGIFDGYNWDLYIPYIDAPYLNIFLIGNYITIEWNPVAYATGYELHYAPYPYAEWSSVIDMGASCHLSGWMPTGSAYYIAIRAKDGNNKSEFSNVMWFVI